MDVRKFFDWLRARHIRVQNIHTFAEFIDECDMFLWGTQTKRKPTYQTPCLVVLGSPGTGKSYYLRSNAQQANCLYRKTDASPVGLYTLAWKALQQNGAGLILDDMDAIYDDKKTVSMLKSMCDEAPQIMSWEKQNKTLMEAGIPTCFETSGRVCLITNELPTKMTGNLKALYSRAETFIAFEPTVPEVHDYVKTWWDMKHHKDVYRLVEDNIEYVHVGDIRLYTHSILPLKRKYPRDWKRRAVQLIRSGTAQGKKDNQESRRMKVIAEILNDPKLKSDKEDREKVWHSKTQLNRSYYYEYKRKWLESHGKSKHDTC